MPPRCSRCGEQLILVCEHCTQIVVHTPFLLSNEEMRAVVRQTFNQYIPHEGTSGPVLHRLLARIREHVGYDTYSEFTAESSRHTPVPVCPQCQTGMCAVHEVNKG